MKRACLRFIQLRIPIWNTHLAKVHFRDHRKQLTFNHIFTNNHIDPTIHIVTENNGYIEHSPIYAQ